VRIELTVNGERLEADLWGGESLLTMLRDTLELPGSKNACEQGECGSCSVLLDGELVCSCLVPAAQANGHAVVTVEGLADGDELHPVQQAFVEAGAVQCGFCTPGFITTAHVLLSEEPDCDEQRVREGRVVGMVAGYELGDTTRTPYVSPRIAYAVPAADIARYLRERLGR